MPTSEQKELKINQRLDGIDGLMEGGPPDVSPEQFLQDLAYEAKQLVAEIEALTPEDVDEIWVEESEEADVE